MGLKGSSGIGLFNRLPKAAATAVIEVGDSDRGHRLPLRLFPSKNVSSIDCVCHRHCRCFFFPWSPIGVCEVSLRELQGPGVMAQVAVDHAGHKEVAVVVARMHSELQRLAAALGRLPEVVRSQLLLEEGIR